MKRYLLVATLLCSAIPAMAQRATPPQTGRPCLRPINMWDFQLVPGNRSLVVIERSRQRFRVNFMSECRNIQFQFRGIRFVTRGTGRLSCVARGDSVRFRDPAGPGICIVREVVWQTPELDQQDAAAGPVRMLPRSSVERR
jgi:hypothetical protein